VPTWNWIGQVNHDFHSDFWNPSSWTSLIRIPCWQGLHYISFYNQWTVFQSSFWSDPNSARSPSSFSSIQTFPSITLHNHENLAYHPAENNAVFADLCRLALARFRLLVVLPVIVFYHRYLLGNPEVQNDSSDTIASVFIPELPIPKNSILLHFKICYFPPSDQEGIGLNSVSEWNPTIDPSFTETVSWICPPIPL